MSFLLSFPVIWSQAAFSGIPEWTRRLLLLGEPTLTLPGPFGALFTWIKVLSLFCLMGWVFAWVTSALKERSITRPQLLDVAALVALFGCLVPLMLSVLESTGRLKLPLVGGISPATLLALVFGLVIFAWVETVLWSTIRRIGNRWDLMVLAGVHLALLLGVGVGYSLEYHVMKNAVAQGARPEMIPTWRDAVIFGARLSATYMGYVVLVRVVGLVLAEVSAVRRRRLYAIGRNSVIESNRRMWAPWVVITVFFVVLAFTHWFLVPPRPAEMGRLFVGTLLLLCSLLLTVMITLLAPLSLPYDIQQQTIYTVVTKPVRRLELIWGRMLGFMVIVTVLTLVFGVISLAYLRRTVGSEILLTEDRAREEIKLNRMSESKRLFEQADQMRTRMSARDPIRGSLSFIDSKGVPRVMGIDVGQEQSMKEPRSHIEGATPSTAIWNFGIVPDPFNPQVLIDRRINVDRLLPPGSIEGLQNRMLELQAQVDAAQVPAGARNQPARKAVDPTRAREELQSVTAAFTQLKGQADALEAKSTAALAAGRADEASQARAEAKRLHAPPISLEMAFNIYRTTKGRLGEPVQAELEITNPRTGVNWRDIIPIREYYTNKVSFPASRLAGSRGDLRVEVRCISVNQYLGMAESDLYILANAGNFGTNFFKGLFGVWLQAMVLTAIGVFAGTFLSWPVALLTTIAFFVGGQVAFSFLLQFTQESLVGGGPFVSLIRLLTHDNQTSDLTPTVAVVAAKTLDALVMPVMARLVYLVPNFSALDVSNTVADGFAVSTGQMISNFFLALAYALPFSLAGYFILKNREVAA